jgi:hemerythrin
MKHGLIVTIERNRVTFETGPNAILLSDVILQSDIIENIALFPVLKMLHRQEFLILDHPNNTGKSR